MAARDRCRCSTPAATTSAPPAGVRGSQHIPLHELADRIDEVPAGRGLGLLRSGYRASIAASLLARAGRRPVLVDDGYADADTGAAAAGLHAQPVPA